MALHQVIGEQRSALDTLRSGALHIVLRLATFALITVLVWMLYVYLFAYAPDFLGWCYSMLRPITIWLFSLVDGSLPEELKYKVSAGLTDELGPRALFLLVLAGVCETVLSFLYWLVLGLIRAFRYR
jgi:hypothetical protein